MKKTTHALRSQIANVFSSLIHLNRKKVEPTKSNHEKTYFFKNSETWNGLNEPLNNKTDLPINKIEKREGIYSWPSQSISEFSEVALLSKSGLAFDEYEVIYNANLPNKKSLKIEIKKNPSIIYNFMKNRPGSNTREKKPVLPLLSYRSDNIYHWISEYLPQLELLNKYRLETNEQPIVLLEANPPEWKLDSLDLFGYTEDYRKYMNVDELLLNRCLLCSSRIQSPEFLPSPRELRFLRKTIVGKTNLTEEIRSDLPRKIYISREKANNRRVVNQKEIKEYLESKGFVEYTLEDIGFIHQILLFRNAETVIAPHGAGLTHIIYPSSINVIEFIPQYYPSVYTVLANMLGHNYQPIIAKKVNSQEDMIVSKEDVDKSLHSV